MTDIPTREGWLDPAAVENLFRRRVVGALETAPARRRPGPGLVARSDRGSPYAREHDRRRSREERITCRRSRRGNGRANAAMESFFARLEKELVHAEDDATREEARASILEYIEVFDNRGPETLITGVRCPSRVRTDA